MHRAVTAGILTFALAYVCGCSAGKFDKLESFLPSREPTLSNQVALDRALRTSSLVEGELPFHLVLEIDPQQRSASGAGAAMHAQVEIYWLNRLTYRTVIHSPTLTQTRIVNGPVVEEHNAPGPEAVGHGASLHKAVVYYPRWLQNFVDALLEPIPQAAQVSKLPGSVPVGPQSHPCLTTPSLIPGLDVETQLCFQGVEPKLASLQDFTRYVSFDDFAPFGSQQIPRRLINSLPTNTLIEGRIVRIEPLSKADYPLLKATQYTPPGDAILTRLVPEATALSQLEFNPGQPWPPARTSAAGPASESSGQLHLYIRTDRTGQVREAYRDPTDHYGLQNAAIAQALRLKFKPLLVDGVARQMEAPLTLP